MLILIQGCSFQNCAELAIGFHSEGVATAVPLGKFNMRWLYSGAIYPVVPGDDMSGELAGELSDVYGLSVLSEIKIAPGTIEFNQKYIGRFDLIHYEFELKPVDSDGHGTYWAGHYSGQLLGRGISNCIITDVPDDFFSYDDAAARLIVN